VAADHHIKGDHKKTHEHSTAEQAASTEAAQAHAN
jgi:hypothetical protein